MKGSGFHQVPEFPAPYRGGRNSGTTPETSRVGNSRELSGTCLDEAHVLLILDEIVCAFAGAVADGRFAVADKLIGAAAHVAAQLDAGEAS